MPPYDSARQNMVNSQLMTNGVLTPSVVEAFGVVPREIFVPAAFKPVAYSDDSLDLGEGRVMISPMVLGKMIENLGVSSDDHVLCVGGTTGYAAAILSWIVRAVTDLECDDRFTADNQLARAAWAVDNVTRVVGDLRGGAKLAEGYDAILVEGALSELPYDIALSLKPGGRMVALVKPRFDQIGTVYVFEKTATGYVASRPLFEATVPYLPGFEPTQQFAFA